MSNSEQQAVEWLSLAEQYFLDAANNNPECNEYFFAEACHRAIEAFKRIEELEQERDTAIRLLDCCWDNYGLSGQTKEWHEAVELLYKHGHVDQKYYDYACTFKEPAP